MVLDDFDEYTRFALPLILNRFPEWGPFAVSRGDTGTRSGWAEIWIQCPSPAVEVGLWVSTDSGELTVGFHTHHCHFNDYSGLNQPHLVESAIEHARAILEDRCGVLSVYDGERFAGSVSCELPHVGPLRVAFSVNRGSRVTLRSWSGRHDRDEVC